MHLSNIYKHIVISYYYNIKRTFKNTVTKIILTLKILKSLYIFLPFTQKIYLIFTIIVLGFYLKYLKKLYIENPLSDDEFLYIYKCPACYGFKACDSFKSDGIRLTDNIGFKSIFYSNFDQVYNGITRDNEKVIITKFTSDQRFDLVDKSLCREVKEKDGCDVSRAVESFFPLSGSHWMLGYLKNLSLMTSCVTKRLLDKMMDGYQEKLDSIMLSSRERIQLVTTLALDQQPILFQTFPAEAGWPFPIYLGACGRVAALQNNGVFLNNFIHEPWIKRAKIALELLEMVKKLTKNKSQYGLYLTNIDETTFQVIQKTMKVQIYNGRDIVIVDLWKKSSASSDNNNQNKQRKNNLTDKNLKIKKKCVTEFRPCSSSSSVISSSSSSEKKTSSCSQIPLDPNICDCDESDTNYYAVCRNILSATYTNLKIDLLERDIPRAIDNAFDVKGLIRRCVEPGAGEERETIVNKLINVLFEITEDSLYEE